MIALLSAVGSLLSFRFRSRLTLELELVALRHQLTVLRRQRPGRPRLFPTDRLLWVWLYRIWPQVIDAMVLVKPTTVIDWHRKGFRLYWRRRSRHLGRPRMNWEIRDLIRQMSIANPLWGAPRIHGELVKLGIAVSQATVGRYMQRLSIAPFDPALKTEETITVDKAALRLGICVGSVYKLIRQGALPATQLLPSAPWEIPLAALDTEAVKTGVQAVIDRRPRNYRSLQDVKTLALPGI